MSATTKAYTEEEHAQRVKRQAIAEQYRNLLLVGPVPARMVEDWAQRMTHPYTLTTVDIEAHFRPLCSPYTFGRWAHAAYVIRNVEVPECVTEIIRNTHLRADASQQLVGALELFNPKRIAPVTQLAELQRASHTTPSMYETVACIVMPPNATKSAKSSALIRRGCDALRELGMTQAADIMWRHHEALLSDENSGKPKAQNNMPRPKPANSLQSPPPNLDFSWVAGCL